MRHATRRVVVVLVGILALFGSACEKKGGQTGPTPIIVGPLGVQAVMISGSAVPVSNDGETFTYDLPTGVELVVEIRLNNPGKPVHVAIRTDPPWPGWPNFEEVRSNSVDFVLLYRFRTSAPSGPSSGITQLVVTLLAEAEGEPTVRRTYTFRVIYG